MFAEVPVSTLLSVLVSDFLLFVIVIVLLCRVNRLRTRRDALVQERDVIFNFLYDVSEVFAETESVDLVVLLNRVLSFALRTSRGRAGALYLTGSDDDTLRVGAVSGIFPPMAGGLGDGLDSAFSKVRYVERLVRERVVDVGEGLVGEVLSRGAPILIEDAERDERVPRFDLDFLKINTILLVPMRFRRRVLGVLVVVNRVDARPFGEADMDLLQALADQASVSIHYAKVSTMLDEKRRLDYDLSIAERIQHELLPKEIPQISGVELAAFSVPAQHIGGDYYDFVDVDEDHLGIAIADVSGKGVSGAIVMSICRSVLRVEAASSLSPAAVLVGVNRVLSVDLSEDMFVSVLYMVLNLKTHELVVSRAGHTYPIVGLAGGAEPRMIKSSGLAIGLGDSEAFEAAIDEKRLQLHSGDMVVAFTDGVTEAHDQGENEWGVLNLVRTVQRTAFERRGAQALASSVHQKLLQFIGDMPQYDDMTVVALRTVD